MHSSQPLDQDPTDSQTSKVSITRASCEASDSVKEWLRFGGIMIGSGRFGYKGSDPTTCFTNHGDVA